MLRKVTLHHPDAKPTTVTIEVDVDKTFTLEEMKACHNVHIHRKVNEVKPGEEPHTFTPDMLAVLTAWNARIGWDGCYRLPQARPGKKDDPNDTGTPAIKWGEPVAARKKEPALAGVS